MSICVYLWFQAYTTSILKEPTMLILENALLRAEFNPDNGALCALVSKATGWHIQRRPELGLSFRMLVPLPERGYNIINGERNRVSSVEVSPDGTVITFVWDRLTSAHGGEHAIGFTGTVTLGENGLTFQGQVRNASDLTVDAVEYPCIGDLSPSSRETTLEQLTPAGHAHLQPASLYPAFEQNAGYWGADHLVQHRWHNTHAPCTLVAEPTQGLYVGAHDREPQMMVKWYFEQKPGHLDSLTHAVPKCDAISGHVVALECTPQHFAFVQPGATRDLLPMVLCPYVGSWHKGLDLYRAWRQTWFTEPKMPAWAKDVHSWLQIQINGAEDNLVFQYKDLPEIAADCKAHGIAAIQLTGWAWGGQDRGNPRHDIDPKLGTREEFVQAIKACQAMGVKIILFTKWTWYDESQPFYQTEGLQHVARDFFGNPFPNSGYQYHTWTQLSGMKTRKLVPTCTASPAWREVAVEEFRKVISLGADGMLFDEDHHHGDAHYCFSREHDHPYPAYLHGYDNVLAREFKAVSEQIDPDFLYAGEDCTDCEMQEYHVPYARFIDGNVPARRYITPHQPIMVAVTGFDDRIRLNKCLQNRYIISYEPFNFKGRPNDAPLTVAYGEKIDALRRRYRDYLWDGVFKHVLGAAVTVDGQAYDNYVVYERADGKRAVIIANQDAEQTLAATCALEDGAKGALVVVDPENPEPRPMGETVEIPPRSVVVMLEQ